MKITNPVRLILSTIAITGFIAAAVLITGCVSPVNGPPVVSTIPGPLVTNPPATPGGAPIVIQLPPVTVTNPGTVSYVPDPRINQYSNYANQGVNLAALAPPAAPYVDLAKLAIAAGFGIVGGISGFFAQKKKTTQSQTMLGAVIQGVESGLSDQAPAVADAVKAAIQSRATSAGVQPTLDSVVQKLT